MSRIECEVGSDSRGVTLKADGEVIAQMTADTLTQLIQMLEEARARMAPPVSNDPNGEPITILGRAGWFVFETRVEGDRALCIRHPGRGWSAVCFSDEDSVRVADLLTRPAKAPNVSGSGSA